MATIAADPQLGTKNFGTAALADHILEAPEQGSGYLYPRTAIGTVLTVFAFGFSVAVLSLVNAHILNAATLAIWVPVAIATGALGQLIGGLWDFRANNLFAATFAVIYAGFLLSTALILKFFAPGIITAAGAANFGDAFGAWLILWAILTIPFAVGARYVALPVFVAFVLLAIVLSLLGIANIAGTGSLATDLTKLAGWLGLATTTAAWYAGSAILLNITCNREMLPLYPYTPKP
jgi:succinate-acetate transporter protein